MKFLVTIFLLCSSSALFAQVDSSSCQRFQKGHFFYVNDSGVTIKVNRTKRFQEEFDPVKKLRQRLRIRWTSACSYELEQVWSNSKAQRRHNGSRSSVVITRVYDNRYEYQCACKNAALPSANAGTMMRAND